MPASLVRLEAVLIQRRRPRHSNQVRVAHSLAVHPVFQCRNPSCRSLLLPRLGGLVCSGKGTQSLREQRCTGNSKLPRHKPSTSKGLLSTIPRSGVSVYLLSRSLLTSRHPDQGPHDAFVAHVIRLMTHDLGRLRAQGFFLSSLHECQAARTGKGTNPLSLPPCTRSSSQ